MASRSCLCKIVSLDGDSEECLWRTATLLMASPVSRNLHMSPQMKRLTNNTSTTSVKMINVWRKNPSHRYMVKMLSEIFQSLSFGKIFMADLIFWSNCTECTRWTYMHHNSARRPGSWEAEKTWFPRGREDLVPERQTLQGGMEYLVAASEKVSALKTL